MQRYFSGSLRPDQWKTWKAEDGIFVLCSEAMGEIGKRDNLIVEQGMQIDQINNILNGEEVCDFALSFPLIRKAADKMNEIEGLRDNKLYLENDLALKMQKVAALEERLVVTEISASKEIAKLKTERAGAFQKWKDAIAKYPNGADGCCCLFDRDQNQVGWCSIHAELRDENIALKAELKKAWNRVVPSVEGR